MSTLNNRRVSTWWISSLSRVRCYALAGTGSVLLAGMFAGLLNAQSTDSSKAQTEQESLQEEVRLLRVEVAQMRTELNSLKQTVQDQQTQRTVTQPPPPTVAAVPSREPATSAPPSQADTQTPSELGTIQTQLAQLAQTKVESNSKMAVKVYGTILSDTFFNSRAVDWADEPVRVLSPSAVSTDTGSFSSSLRQSRIGLLVDGPDIGSFHTSGVFALDFNGGQTDFSSSPLFGLADVVYAYVRFENPRTAIEAGQDEMIFAPQNPTSLVSYAYPQLYSAGNLYVRTPQVRVEQKLIRNNQGSLKLTAGLVAPIGTYPPFDNPNPAAPTPNGWQRPAIQERLSWQSASLASGNDSGFELGVSGHYGRVGLAGFSAASWGSAFDFNVRHQKIGFDGEGFLGQNLGVFGGGSGQPGKTMGGYIEGRLLPSSRLQFNAGFGTDHLTKFDVIPVPINRNSALFANTIFQFTPEVAASLEYKYMFLKPFGAAVEHNNNLSLGIAYSF